jgi:hypothetical protein
LQTEHNSVLYVNCKVVIIVVVDLNDAQKTVDVLCTTLAAGLAEGDFEHDAEFMDKFDTLINYAANILADAEAKVEDLVKAVNDPESLLDILKEAQVYFHLLKYGAKPLSVLARHMKTYREDVYRTLTRLIDKGMVKPSLSLFFSFLRLLSDFL